MFARLNCKNLNVVIVTTYIGTPLIIWKFYMRNSNFFIVVFVALISCQSQESVSSYSDVNPTLELDSMDAVIAAPESHEILLENDRVRVLRVKINPGEREPMHNHNWESVMYVDHPAMIKYYDDKGNLVFESNKSNFSYDVGNPSWMEAEGIHAVENIDTLEYSAIRVELKD